MDRDQTGHILQALGERLSIANVRTEIVVVGGSALITLGLVDRATRDVDVVALRDGDALISPDPLPQALIDARDRVAADYGLAENWLNTGPSDLLAWGLPEGFVDRLTSVAFGPSLVVHLASRFDLIHLKLYAVADQGAGRHEEDLQALAPTHDELLAAARWSRTHDPSPGFRSELERTLHRFGVEDASLDA